MIESAPVAASSSRTATRDEAEYVLSLERQAARSADAPAPSSSSSPYAGLTGEQIELVRSAGWVIHEAEIRVGLRHAYDDHDPQLTNERTRRGHELDALPLDRRLDLILAKATASESVLHPDVYVAIWLLRHENERGCADVE
jgi:hypothetical protein